MRARRRCWRWWRPTRRQPPGGSARDPHGHEAPDASTRRRRASRTPRERRRAAGATVDTFGHGRRPRGGYGAAVQAAGAAGAVQGLYRGAAESDGLRSRGLRAVGLPHGASAEGTQGAADADAGAAGVLPVVLLRAVQRGPAVPGGGVPVVAVADGTGNGREAARWRRNGRRRGGAGGARRGARPVRPFGRAGGFWGVSAAFCGSRGRGAPARRAWRRCALDGRRGSGGRRSPNRKNPFRPDGVAYTADRHDSDFSGGS